MRKFLVVLDDSRECLNAMRFAAMRAAHTGAKCGISHCIQAFAAVVENHKKLAHETPLSGGAIMACRACGGNPCRQIRHLRRHRDGSC